MRKISKILILLLMVFGLSSCGLFADPYGDSEDINNLEKTVNILTLVIVIYHHYMILKKTLSFILKEKAVKHVLYIKMKYLQF